MMDWTPAIVIALLMLSLWEVVPAFSILKRLQQPRSELNEDFIFPPAAVILPLRGADPSLEACLRALVEQDYPDYRIHIILDSRDDPAAALVRRFAAEQAEGLVHVDYLAEVPTDSSLKCACLAQVLAELPADVEVIAFTDADAVPARHWLRALTARLAASGADAVSGIRWYDPHGRTAAALFRYVWNAASVVQMYRHGIAWGGCLALRRKIIAETDLVQRLRRAWGEDTVLDSVLRARGLKLDVDPALVMISREDTTPGAFLGWACRQLLSARLHHSGWIKILLSGLLQWLLILACGALFLHGLWIGNGVQATTAGLALLLYELLQTGLLLTGERLIRRQVPEQYAAISPPHLLPLLLIIPLAQCLNGLLFIAAQLCRRVTWRGIVYRVGGKAGIRMLGYKLYVQEEEKGNRSL